ncbi:MAG TPA: hypothetical protein VL860_00030, partial [Planctomycetota bacterium]|nr:hypothetical protein [Planctomycetota bacterium]
DLAGLPRVVFMDYFLGEGCNGADLARKMLDYWRARSACAKKAPRPILIGHSSVPDCSALIASIGKSFALEKHSGESVSAAILRVFDTEEKRSYLWKHGMPMSRA